METLEKSLIRRGNKAGMSGMPDVCYARNGVSNGASASSALLHGQSLYQSLADDELYKKCQEYGMNARLWNRKFAGLLPGVYRRHLYKKKGYVSIHEFAAKLAGMSQATVEKILNLSERLKDKPKLLELLENGSAGWSKLQTVAYIATPESDKEWVEKIKKLSQHSLEAYVKEVRNRLEFTRAGDGENNQQTLQEAEGIAVEKWNTLYFSVHPIVEKKLRLVMQDLEKEKKQALSWNDVMGELVKAFEENRELKQKLKKLEKALQGKAGSAMVKPKVITTNICPSCVGQEMDQKEIHGETKRAIPVKVEKIIEQRSGRICEFPGCTDAGEIRHHVRRYALRKNHDPRYIVFLCKAHEGIAQAGLIENEEDLPATWRVREKPNQTDPKFLIDEKVAEFRKEQ